MKAAINTLLSNYMSLVTVCEVYIGKGQDAEFFQECKDEAIERFERICKIFCEEIKETEEIENGSYQADEDERRECEREELELVNNEID